jgi:hypothetical protein
MVFDDSNGNIILGIMFIIIGAILRYKPAWIFKHWFTRHGLRMINAVISWRRLVVIMKFIGLAFLLMGIVALIISLGIRI